MKLVSDLKQFLILNDFPSVNDAISLQNQQLRSLQEECDKKLISLRDEIAIDLYELEEEYYSSRYKQAHALLPPPHSTASVLPSAIALPSRSPLGALRRGCRQRVEFLQVLCPHGRGGGIQTASPKLVCKCLDLFFCSFEVFCSLFKGRELKLTGEDLTSILCIHQELYRRILITMTEVVGDVFIFNLEIQNVLKAMPFYHRYLKVFLEFIQRISILFSLLTGQLKL